MHICMHNYAKYKQKMKIREFEYFLLLLLHAQNLL